jgi:hypothetical protein
MTPEERDRLTKLEVEITHLKDTQDKILKMVTEMNNKSNRLTGGIIVLVAVGGIVSWIIQTIAWKLVN